MGNVAEHMDVGGMIPWMESVESSLGQRPRATHGDKAERPVKQSSPQATHLPPVTNTLHTDKIDL